MKIQLSSYMGWRLIREAVSQDDKTLIWRAWRTDHADPETGSPVFESYSLDMIVGRIEDYEKGAQSHE